MWYSEEERSVSNLTEDLSTAKIKIVKKTYYHGTSADNLPGILKDGFNPYQDKIWSPSENGSYFWCPDSLAAADGEEGEEEDYKQGRARERAYESAQMALAVGKSGKCVVFAVEMDDENMESDESCPNMDGAVVSFENIKPEQIKEVWISPDLSMLKGYFVAIAMNHDFFCGEFTETEKQIGKIFSKAEFYFDSSDFPLEKMD